MRRLAAVALVSLILIPLAAFAQGAVESRGPRPEVVFGPKPHYVTLTFYCDNTTSMQELVNVLADYNVTSAVFFIGPATPQDPPAIQAARSQGFAVLPWQDKQTYDVNYPPSQFQNVTLADRAVFARTAKMADVSAFYNLALHSSNSSIVAFTPDISGDSLDLLRDLLHNSGTLVFASQPAAGVAIPMSASPAGNVTGAGPIGSNTTSKVLLDAGRWDMQGLLARYPADISTVLTPDGPAYLVDSSVIIGPKAELDILNETVLIASPSGADSDRRIEAQGNLTVSGSVVSSWDAGAGAPDLNPYHQRPFIFADKGRLAVQHSQILHMGFLVAGFSQDRTGRAAVVIHDSTGFSVANSTLAFDLDALYARNSNSSVIVGNEIYGNTRSGIDIRAGSHGLEITGNRVHDNGYEGIVCIQCAGSAIAGNTVEHNKEAGIKLVNSSSTAVQQNELRYNEKFGIFLRDGSTGNSVQSNTVEQSREAIKLEGGSAGNVVFGNTLAGNDASLVADATSRVSQPQNGPGASS